MSTQSRDKWQALTGLGIELKRCDECGTLAAEGHVLPHLKIISLT